MRARPAVPEVEAEGEREQREQQEQVPLLESSAPFEAYRPASTIRAQREEDDERGERRSLRPAAVGEADERARDEHDAAGERERKQSRRGPAEEPPADVEVGDAE